MAAHSRYLYCWYFLPRRWRQEYTGSRTKDAAVIRRPVMYVKYSPKRLKEV